MKFIKAQDDPVAGLLHRYVSENGLIEIGFYRVIFGMRLRAGFTSDNGCYVIDWCLGTHNFMYAIGLLFRILEQREESHSCFKGIPTFSKIKPIWNDDEFMSIINNLAFYEENSAQTQNTDLPEQAANAPIQEGGWQQGADEAQENPPCEQETGGVAEAIQRGEETTSGSCGVCGLQDPGPMG